MCSLMPPSAGSCSRLPPLPILSPSLPAPGLSGGTAYLSLEAQEEPYLGGIKYTAMPPTKRFRDMEQLSGRAGATE
jgi:hypothetical protein